MRRKEIIDSIAAAAEPLYGTRETAAIARLVIEKRYGLSRAECALEPHALLDPGVGFEQLLADIASARPIQYILGVADFDGIELAVGEGVLIPRPETEELVRWIADDTNRRGAADARLSQKIRILDIGTGSGAIAIALAGRLPGASVTAIDISPKALEYAHKNNQKTGSLVDIEQADILDPKALDSARFDIIVSNPPYIPEAERGQMAANVTGYEPRNALFVPDDDPLIFYRAIARFARRSPAPEGTLYFEIHEAAAYAVAELLRAEGFGEIEVRCDINSKPRMVRCRP